LEGTYAQSWLSAANSWAGAMRGLWTAELHRQQAAMANEMIRQTIDFLDQNRDGGGRRPQAEASRLRAGSDQRKLCSDGPFARYNYADSRADAGPPARLPGRWRHNQQAGGEWALRFRYRSAREPDMA
jgi:hypothetical protein